MQLYFFSHILDQKDRNRQLISRLGFSIVTLIGLFANIFTVIFTVALCLSQILVFRNFRQWLQWWIPTILLSLPATLFYLIAPNATDPTSIQVTRQGLPIVQNALFVLYGILVGITYGPPQEQLHGNDKIQILLGHWYHLLVLLIVVTIIVFALIVTLLNRYQNTKEQAADCLFVSIFFISFCLAFLVAIVTKINWLPRHSFYLYLPLAITIPSAFVRRKYRDKIQINPVSQYAQIATVSLIILNIYSLSNYYFNQDYEKDDYRSAAQYLVENRNDSAKSILLWGSTTILNHYGDDLTLDGRQLLQEKFTAQKINDLTSNVNTVFLAVNRKFDLFSENILEEKMSKLYILNSQVDFPCFKIYRFTKRTAHNSEPSLPSVFLNKKN